jgi:hypothetical protein
MSWLLAQKSIAGNVVILAIWKIIAARGKFGLKRFLLFQGNKYRHLLLCAEESFSGKVLCA